MTKYITAVYEIRDADTEVVRYQLDHFKSMMSAYHDSNQPLAISAMARSDAINALEKIEALIEELGSSDLKYAVEEVLSKT